MGPDWAGIIVAVLVGVANLAVTLWLNRRRQGEIEAQRRATEAKPLLRTSALPLRSCLHELESLRAKIAEAADQATESERQRAAGQIFRNEETQVLALPG
jgi:type VI protein secretion system component VasK